jgi:hypothetical protein
MITRLFIKEFTLAGIILLLVSCNAEKKNTAPQNNIADTTKATGIKKDSPVLSTIIPVTDTTLKNVSINENYFNQKTSTHTPINRSLFDTLGLAKIPVPSDLKKDTSFKIKIIDTLISNDKIKILIVSVESENERWAWLLAYDKNSKVVRTEKVFYEDLVEYFSKTATEVKNNKIFIATETEIEDSKTKMIKKFIFKDGAKLESIK